MRENTTPPSHAAFPHKGGNPWHDPKTGRFTSGPDGDDKPLLTITAPRKSAHWQAKSASIKISDQIRARLDLIAKAFHDATGKDLVITDGDRTTRDQAERMYNKYALGDFKTYRGTFAAKIANVFRVGQKNGIDKEEILSEMTKIISEIVEKNQPISYHLSNRAVDIRSNSMTKVEKSMLESIIAKNGGVPLHEGVPEHIHATFRRN